MHSSFTKYTQMMTPELTLAYFTTMSNVAKLVFSSPEPKVHGELIRYPYPGVRPSSTSLYVVVHNFKHHLQNRLLDQSQILCGASLGRGNEIFFSASGSHDQDGRHAHIW